MGFAASKVVQTLISALFPSFLFVRVEFESEFRRACYAEFEVPGTPVLFAMIESLQKIWVFVSPLIK